MDISTSKVLLFFTSIGLIVSCLNGFNAEKTLYALYYPEKYFIKDTLQYTSEEVINAASETGSTELNWYFGILLKTNIHSEVAAYEHEAISNVLPVWYCTLTKSSQLRESEDLDSPFSFSRRSDQIATLLDLLWLPSLLYFIYLKRKKQ